VNDFHRSLRSQRKYSILKDYLVFEKFFCKKKSQETRKGFKIFGIIYLSFLNIPFRGFVQKYPNTGIEIIALIDVYLISISTLSLLLTPNSTHYNNGYFRPKM
jgi:hypothetical protein